MATRKVADNARDKYAARFCRRLKARRDIDRIAKDILRLDDHIADMDSGAEADRIVVAEGLVGRAECVLDGNGAVKRLDRRGKLDQRPIAEQLDHPAVMRGDGGRDDLAKDDVQRFQQPGRIRLHHPAETDDIEGEYRRKALLTHRICPACLCE